MTLQEFDDKWKDYLEPRFYGLAINDTRVIDYLDKEFEKEILINPNFDYAQIKLKFGTARVYATSKNESKWEHEINKILKDEKVDK